MALVTGPVVRPPELTDGTTFREKETGRIVKIAGAEKLYDGQMLLKYLVIGHIDENESAKLGYSKEFLMMPRLMFLERFVQVRSKSIWVDVPPRYSDAAKNDKFLQEYANALEPNTYMFGDLSSIPDTTTVGWFASTTTPTTSSIISAKPDVSETSAKTQKVTPIDPVAALEAFKKKR